MLEDATVQDAVVVGCSLISAGSLVAGEADIKSMIIFLELSELKINKLTGVRKQREHSSLYIIFP
jgi:hypothetical protein